MRDEGNHTVKPAYDENSIRDLFNSKFCLMGYGRNKERIPCGVTYFNSVDLQSINLYKLRSVGFMRLNRTRRHILAESNRDFLLSIPLSHRSLVMHAGVQSVCEPGNFRLLSASIPFSSFSSQFQPLDCPSGLSAKISGSLLRQLVHDIDDYPDLVLKIRPGAGKIMKALIETGLTEGKELSTSQARDFGKTIIHAIANAVLEAPELGIRQAKAHRSSHERIRETAKDFISRNLSNPMLDCALIASHCQISETYLHVAFESAPVKVGAYIREARLVQCRRDLRNPALRHHSITEIMMNWGFDDLSSFGRTYKARFGITPRQERNSAASFA